MAKRTIEVNVTYKYTLEVDDENYIVQEYADDDELVKDLASYKFQVLPVLEEEGVKIEDWEVLDIEIN